MSTWSFGFWVFYGGMLVLLAVVACLPTAAQAEMVPPLNTAIDKAAHVLAAQMTPTGAFVYQVRTDGVPMKNSYNMTRHAGALYSLNQYRAEHKDAAIDQVAMLGLTYLKSTAKAVPSSVKDPAVAIFLPPDFGKGMRTVLGATALGAVAVLTAPDFLAANHAFATSLGRFLLSMQKSDGAFYSAYYLDGDRRSDEFYSLYYPGEAALALALLYEKDAAPARDVWGNAARDALLYMARSRAMSQQYPPDNWALAATKALLQSGFSLSDKEKAELITHAERVATTDMLPQLTEKDGPEVAGAFTAQGNTSQTATRLEGLLSAWTFIQTPQLRATMRTNIVTAMNFLRRCQLHDGPYAGSYSRTAAVDPVSFGHVKLRIDYTQHALTAMLLYRQAGFDTPSVP